MKSTQPHILLLLWLSLLPVLAMGQLQVTNVVVTPVTCNGLSDGVVGFDILPSGGGNNTVILNGDTVDTNANNSVSIPGLNAGLKEIKVRKNSGADSITFFVFVSEPPALVGSVLSTTDVACNGASSGEVVLSAVGGTPPYSYRIDGQSSQGSAVFSGLAAGTYDFIIDDANGCSDTLTGIAINQPAAPVTAAIDTVVDVKCPNGNDGSIVIDVSGGTSPYTASAISGNLTFNEQGNGPQLTISGLVAGTYSVSVIDAQGCNLALGNQTVNNASGTPLTVSVDSVAPAACSQGGTSNGLAIISGQGGTPPYEYSEGGQNYSSNDTFSLAASSVPYFLFVRDANGCIASAAVTIPNAGNFSISVTDSIDIACQGESTGSITVQVNGGQAPFTYDLNPGGTSQSPTFNNLSAGSYTITASDANNCTATTPIITLDEPASPLDLTTVSKTPTGCAGGTGTIKVAASGGAGGYEFSLNGGVFSPNDSLTGLSAGSILISVRDANGCIDTINETINSTVALPQINNLQIDSISCFGATDGAISFTVGSGTPAYIVDLEKNSTPFFKDTLPNSSTIFTSSNLGPGNYSIAITDQSGCVFTSQVNLAQPAQLTLGIDSLSNVNCIGQSTGFIRLQAIGGTPPYSYTLAGQAPSIPPATFSSLAAGSYPALVVDANNCSTTVNFSITEPTTGTVAEILNLADNYCLSSDTVLVQLVGAPSGGTFSLGPNAGSNDLNGNQLILVDPVSDLVVNYSGNDALGCPYAASDTITITQRPQFPFDQVLPDFTCAAPDSVLLITMPPSEHSRVVSGIFSGPGVQQISKDSAIFSPAFGGPGPKVITYDVIDTSGCAVALTDTILVRPIPQVGFSWERPCAQVSTIFRDSSVAIGPGASIDRRIWRFGDLVDPDGSLDTTAVTIPYTYTFPGNYTVSLQIVDNLGCENKYDTLVSVYSLPEARFDWDKVCFSDSTRFLNSTQTQDLVIDSAMIWIWDFGDGTISNDSSPSHVFGIPGLKTVTLQAGTFRECFDTLTQVVSILDTLQILGDGYFENFNGGPGGWFQEPESKRGWEWTFASASVKNIEPRGFGDRYWIMGPRPTAYPEGESSWVNSPCFNLVNLERPMISMDIWSWLKETEGAVLQARVEGDDDPEWEVVGSVENGLPSGINWYNRSGINGDPGQQVDNRYGWSFQERPWREASHRLDEFVDRARSHRQAGKTSLVRLRVAFGSRLAPDPTDGFAFDDVRIKERNRRVLVEHFTCLDCPLGGDVQTRRDMLGKVESRSKDVLAMQYDARSDNNTCFYAFNPSAPNARRVFYGLNDLNRVILAGNRQETLMTDSLTVRDLDLLMLEEARFDLRRPTLQGNALEVTLAARDSFAGELALFVTLVGDSLPEGSYGCWPMGPYRQLVLGFAPNEAGSYSNRSWVPGDSLNFRVNLSNLPNPEIFGPDTDGNLLVFIQDLQTGTVFQAAQVNAPQFVTSLEDEFFIPGWQVFPNPVDYTATIELQEPLLKATTWQIFDFGGRLVMEGKLLPGQRRETLNLGELAEGIYQIGLLPQEGPATFKKLVKQ